MRTRTGQARPRSSRRGFTLVELLVVITIIAVLAALSTAAYQRVRVAGKRTATVSDINNMNLAITKFKQDFGFNPPQYMRFPVTAPPNAGVNGAEMDAGYAILKSMFRAYNAPAAATPFGSITNMNGQTISGSQCLVFFLGGPQLQGFDSTGPYNPAPNVTSKKGPYFDFDLNRVFDNKNATDYVNNNRYLDTWGTPYAYFSSGRSDNYIYAMQSIPTDNGIQNIGTLKDSSGKWVNTAGVQIISAGPNQLFGPGSLSAVLPAPAFAIKWTPETAPYGPGDPGEDDIANFNGGLQLGSSSR